MELIRALGACKPLLGFRFVFLFFILVESCVSKVNHITQSSTTMVLYIFKVHRSTWSIGQLAGAFQQLYLHRVYLTLSVIKRSEDDADNWFETGERRRIKEHNNKEDNNSNNLIGRKQKTPQRNDENASEFEKFSTLYHRVILYDAISGLWGKFSWLWLASPVPCQTIGLSPPN